MTLLDSLGKIDITQAGLATLVWVVVAYLMYFVSRQFWPWYTKEYWPNRSKREEAVEMAKIAAEGEQTKALQSIRDAMIEIRTLSSQQLMLLQSTDSQSKATLATLANLPTHIEKNGLETIAAVKAMLPSQQIAITKDL
jgi:hypothetical protein